MTIKVAPFPLPPTANLDRLSEFGRVVLDVNPAKLSESEFKEIENLLYKVSMCICLVDRIILSMQHSALLFKNVDLSPEDQYALTKVGLNDSPIKSSCSPDPGIYIRDSTHLRKAMAMETIKQETRINLFYTRI